MRLIKPSIEFLWITPEPLETIEKAGRTCYKSEDKIASTSAERFVQKLLMKGHFAMIEHASASYRVVCDRGVTHEIVRHRLFSYAQESTRYCDYKGGVTFIIPPWIVVPGKLLNSEVEFDDEGFLEFSHSTLRKCVQYAGSTYVWFCLLQRAERAYKVLRDKDWTPQQARSVLPNALKTEIVITGNLREWLHFFKLRTAKTAHPQMQEIANMLLEDIRSRVSVIFDEL